MPGERRLALARRLLNSESTGIRRNRVYRHERCEEDSWRQAGDAIGHHRGNRGMGIIVLSHMVGFRPAE